MLIFAARIEYEWSDSIPWISQKLRVGSGANSMKSNQKGPNYDFACFNQACNIPMLTLAIFATNIANRYGNGKKGQ
jgi:K+ transporter